VLADRVSSASNNLHDLQPVTPWFAWVIAARSEPALESIPPPSHNGSVRGKFLQKAPEVPTMRVEAGHCLLADFKGLFSHGRTVANCS
jgi:hypothetical protein